MHDYNTYVWPTNCIHKHDYTQNNKLVSALGTQNDHNKMEKTTDIVTLTTRASFRHIKAGVGVFHQSIKQSILSLLLPSWSPPCWSCGPKSAGRSGEAFKVLLSATREVTRASTTVLLILTTCSLFKLPAASSQAGKQFLNGNNWTD